MLTRSCIFQSNNFILLLPSSETIKKAKWVVPAMSVKWYYCALIVGTALIFRLKLSRFLVVKNKQIAEIWPDWFSLSKHTSLQRFLHDENDNIFNDFHVHFFVWMKKSVTWCKKNLKTVSLHSVIYMMPSPSSPTWSALPPRPTRNYIIVGLPWTFYLTLKTF